LSIWASIALALLNLAVSLADFLGEKKLIEQGENSALLTALEAANARISAAIAARRAVTGGVPGDDPYIRD
jgi:hypothetical protein